MRGPQGACDGEEAEEAEEGSPREQESKGQGRDASKLCLSGPDDTGKGEKVSPRQQEGEGEEMVGSDGPTQPV